MKAVLQIAPPTTVQGIKLFLGMLVFYQRFIPKLAITAAPLWKLCKKKVPFKWEGAEQEAFLKLKQCLSEAPVVRLPRWDLMFSIKTDASGYGLGAVLTQEDSSGSWPVVYASQTLREAETRYSATEREGLAVVWAVRLFESYIMGMPFRIITDHAPLKALRTKSNLEGRLLKLAEKLSAYDYDIIYRPGKENVVADLLSRALLSCPQEPTDPENQAEIQEANTRNRIYIQPHNQMQVLRDLHIKSGGHFRFEKLY